MKRVVQSVTRFLNPGTLMIGGLVSLDAYWRHKENPESSWLGVAKQIGAEIFFYDVLLGRAAWPVIAAQVLPAMVGAGAEYYTARKVDRYFTMGSPVLGGMYSNFQMSPTAFQMHSQGLSQIRESRRIVGATMGNEAAYYARRRR